MNSVRMVCMLSRVARGELRVYQRLDSFGPGERQRWETYAASGRRAPSVRDEAPAGWASLDRLFQMMERGDAEAHLLQRDGDWFVCPRRFELRAMAGLLSFRRAALPALAECVLPQEQAEEAARLYERVRARHPERRSHVVSSAWHIPEHWFVAFEESDRRYHVDGDGRASVTYETNVGDARDRVSDAIEVVVESGLPEVVVSGLRNMAAWLDGFPDDSRLELDYGTVADLFSHEALADDHSARDAHAALDALARGDAMRSTFFYAALTQRWSHARSRESSS